MSSFSYDRSQTFDGFLPARCIVHFRPKKGWKGIGYGFDWMRMGDTGEFGDKEPYKKIVGKQYNNQKTVNNAISQSDYAQVGTLVTRGNEYQGDFPPTGSTRNKFVDAILYNSLERDYHRLIMVAKPTSSDYCCPWLSLYPETLQTIVPQLQNLFNNKPVFAEPSRYPNTKAELRLYLEMLEKPDYLEFKYDTDCFEIDTPTISAGLQNGFLAKTITCKTAFWNDQPISVFACKKNKVTGKIDKNLAGRLYAWANSILHRKIPQAVMVQITTPSMSLKGKQLKGDTTSPVKYLNRYLSQALIQVNVIDTVSLNVSADPGFRAFISKRNRALIDSEQVNGNGDTLTEYLAKKLKKQLVSQGKDAGLYEGVCKFYCFGERGADGIVGYYDPYSTHDLVVFYYPDPAFAALTPPHELLHRFLLAHSFSNSECSTDLVAKCTYKGVTTDNIMDYSNTTYSLWHWQWEVANSNAH